MNQIRKMLIALPLVLAMGLPVVAQDSPPPADPEIEEGFSLMEEGAKLLLRGLMSEVEPALKDMEQALTEMEPALKELLAMIDDIRNYDAPEMLPNGDIIIRRKTPLTPLPETDAPETEL